MYSRRICAALLAASLLIFLLLAVPFATSASSSTSGAPTVGFLGIRNGIVQPAEGRNPYGYVILKAGQHGQIATLKAAHPGIKVLVYKDMAATMSYAARDGVDDLYLSSGVGYAYADSNHPGWFLLDEEGERIEWADYKSRWWMDVGLRSYQDAWAENVLAEMQADGWDGVMIDDANAHRGAHLPAGRNIAKYPTDEAYAAATESFLARVAPRILSAGFAAFPNVSFQWSPAWADLYGRWAAYGSGTLREYFTKPGMTSDYERYADGHWRFSLEQMEVVEAQGKTFLPVTYGSISDTQTMRYARASFLLAWGGGASSLIYSATDSPEDPWSPEWTIEIGTPLGDRYAVGDAWRRDFTGGTVVVNPSSSTTATVELGGTYYRPDGSAVTDVVLAPTTGVVLSRAATIGDSANQDEPAVPVSQDEYAVQTAAAATNAYFAEGYTGPGFEQYLTIQNLSARHADVTVEYLFNGAPPLTRVYSVAPHARHTINVNDDVGPDAEVATHLWSTEAVAVERPMYFVYRDGIDGGSSATGLDTPRKEHYFAEGYTGEGFDTYLTLLNPNHDPASVEITYMLGDGRTEVRHHSVAARSRATVTVADEIGRGAEVSMQVRSDLPTVVERPMYFRYGDGITGGTTGTGAASPSTRLLFAEGYTGGGFEQYVTLQNPHDTPADVTLTYRFAGGGALATGHHVPPRSRATIRANDEVGPDREFGLEVDAAQPVVAERVIYFRHGDIDGGSATPGAPEAVTHANFAEGYTGAGFDQYLSLLNPGAVPAHVKVKFQFPDRAPETVTVAMAPGQRHTLRVNDIVGPDQEVSTAVVSDVPIVSERPLYFRYQGHITDGSSVMG